MTRHRIEPLLRPLLMVLVSAAVLGAATTSYFKLLKVVETDPTVTIFQVTHSPILFGAVGVLAAHLAYLTLIVREFVLLRPFDYSDSSKLWLPALLCLAYSSAGVDAYFGFERQLISTTVFAVVYAMWLKFDLQSLSGRREGDPDANTRHRIWTGVDFLAALILAIAVLSEFADRSFGLVDVSLLGLGLKDLIVCSSLVVWLWTASIVKAEARDHFFQDYQQYLIATDYIGIEPQEVESCWGPNPSTEGAQVRVLDFACADSRRAMEILDALGYERSQIDLLRYDSEEKWGSTPVEGVFSQRFCSDTKSLGSLSELDVIIGSHILYEHRLSMEFAAILADVRQGARVLLRGYGPRSFFAPVLMQRSMGLFFASPAPLWNQAHLVDVMARGNLIRVGNVADPNADENLIGPPHLTIQQDLIVHRGNIDHLHSVLQVLYGLYSAQTIREIVAKLLHQAGGPGHNVQLCVDDYVYIFEKNDKGSEA